MSFTWSGIMKKTPVRGYSDYHSYIGHHNKAERMNTVGHLLLVILTVSVISAGVILRNQLMQMHSDNIRQYKSIPRNAISQSKVLMSLRRMQQVVGSIAAQKNCSHSTDYTDITSEIAEKLSELFEDQSRLPVRKICDVPSSTIPHTNEEFAESDDEDSDREVTYLDMVGGVVPWVYLTGVWIYRLVLVAVIGYLMFEELPVRFRSSDGVTFIQETVLILVLCVGYFPHVLMDVCGSHCMTWYFSLGKAMSRVLWIIIVCFVNHGISEDMGLLTPAYVVFTFSSIILMYNGFYPERMFT
ncbi:uncharacterized protein [Argopecten irradians]|uniref:uncharacterized protein n=1 Tax=Argopecten irradians TaxID=31199 RepID=UPI00370FF3A9